MIKYSVIIPAYNCAKTIENTVGSILMSGLIDFEIVIVDDGSTDGTGKICDEMGLQHGCIRCVHQKNAGVSAARNRGIKEAAGEYVWFFDADDSVDESALCGIADIISEKSPDMLIFGISFDYYFSGKMYRRDELYYDDEGVLTAKKWSELLLPMFASNSLSTVCNKFIKREIIIGHKIRFNEKIFEMEDFLFVINCLTHCDGIYMLPKAIYRYKQTETGKNTYNRLCRVDSLTDYMKPFEDALTELEENLGKRGIALADREKVVNEIYLMLFREQIYFAETEGIKKAASDMLGGKYAEVVKNTLPVLYGELANGKFEKVHLRYMKSRLRHFAAVRYKYLRSL